MIASTMARETLLNEDAKKRKKIKDLQSFVSRFSANASKAKQATSRANQIKKIKLDEIKKSTTPTINTAQNEDLITYAVIFFSISESVCNV